MTLLQARAELVANDIVRKGLPLTRTEVAAHVAQLFPAHVLGEEERHELTLKAVRALEQRGYEPPSPDLSEESRTETLGGEALVRAGARILRRNAGMGARAVYHALCTEHRVAVPIGHWVERLHRIALTLAVSDLDLDEALPRERFRTLTRPARRPSGPLRPSTRSTTTEPPSSDDSPKKEKKMDTHGGTTTPSRERLGGKELVAAAAEVLEANPTWGSRLVYEHLEKRHEVTTSLSSFQAGAFTEARKKAGLFGRPTKPKSAGAKKRAARKTAPGQKRRATRSETKSSKSETTAPNRETKVESDEPKSPNRETPASGEVLVSVKHGDRRLDARMNGSGTWVVELHGVPQAELEQLMSSLWQRNPAA